MRGMAEPFDVRRAACHAPHWHRLRHRLLASFDGAGRFTGSMPAPGFSKPRSGVEPQFCFAGCLRLGGIIGPPRPEHAIGNLFIAVFTEFEDVSEQRLESRTAVRLFVVFEAVPERDDQCLPVFVRQPSAGGVQIG